MTRARDLADSADKDIAGTLTLDGLTVDGDTNGDPSLAHFYNVNTGAAAEATAYITNSATKADGLFLQQLGSSFTTTGGFVQDGSTIGSGTGASGGLSIMTRAAADMRFYTNGHTNERLRISSGGDISFYEDTGTTAKFFWDASAESLGIGTTSPLNPLHINVGTDQNLRVFSASSTPTIGSLNDANSAYAALGYTGSQHEFRLGTTEAMRIDSSGNVGIGTSSPNSPLEVSNGTENHRVAFGTGEVYLMARNASSYITQEYIANQHVFTGYGDNSSNEAMRIDSSGNLLVGTTSTATNDVGFKVFQSTGQTVTTASGTNPVLFNRKTSDGDIAIFRKDDVTVGSIGSNSSGGQPLLDINAQTTGSSQMRFTTSGSERMRILSGGGVRIAQTSADWGYLSVQQDFDAKSDTGVASGGYAYIQLPDYAHAGLIIVKVINDGNSNANLSRLYLYNSRPTAFGGGNDVSQIGGTHGSTGTSQEPYANSPVITNNSSGTNARLRLTVGLNSGTGSVSVYARCINI